MASENIQLVISARDQASGQLKGLRANLTALGSRSSGALGGVIGGFTGMLNPGLLAMGAITGVAGALISGAKSAIEEKEQLGRLDQALANNVQGWNGNRSAIDKAIESGQEMAFTDDSLRESLIKLVPAAKSADKAIKLQQLAMDIARGRNIDLATATDIVIKANMGNVGALRKMGIELDKGATKTEILTELQRIYAGQADKFASSAEGSLQRGKIKLDEFLEDSGGAVSDFAGTAILAFENMGRVIDHELTTIFDNEHLSRANIRRFDLAGYIEDEAKTWEPRLQDIGAFVASEVTDRYARDALEKARFATGNMVGQGVIGEIQRKINDAKALVEASFRGLGNSMADGLRSNKDSVKSAMDDLLYVINHPLKLEKETARVEAALTSKNLLKGLSSENPAIKAQAEQTKARLVELWQQLTGIAWTESNETSDNLHTGLKADYPAIRSEARDLVRDLNSIYGGVRLGNTGSTTGRNNTTRPGRRRRQRAAGGPVSEGETYLVGERGPELLTMGRSGHVTPNHRMGGSPIVVNVDGRELFRIMDTRMGRQMALASTADYTRS